MNTSLLYSSGKMTLDGILWIKKLRMTTVPHFVIVFLSKLLENDFLFLIRWQIVFWRRGTMPGRLFSVWSVGAVDVECPKYSLWSSAHRLVSVFHSSILKLNKITYYFHAYFSSLIYAIPIEQVSQHLNNCDSVTIVTLVYRRKAEK